ncbi:MAG: hypothetical protein GDA46_05040 [Bdellovibrionales bacterium]|nr:hypothetical protein [Bdellovibrionales bacterium]
MGQFRLQFHNQDSFYSPFKRRSFFSIKKLSLFLFFFLSVVFFSVKFVYFLPVTKLSLKVPPKSQEVEDHIVPLWVNLKGQEGPQIAKVFVFMSLNSKEGLSQESFEKHKLENKLLFLLSGQSVSSLNHKEFQNQIQNQLNIFLTDQIINELKIQTEILN